ncbi:hypothetical protein LguiB_013496 [Lonicera macranthoides]
MDATSMPGMQDNMTMAGMHNHTTTTMGMTMHTAFYWGNDAEFLFSGWPGTNKSGMYVLSLILIFALAFIVEWLSHSTFIKQVVNDISAGLLQTLMYTIRIGLAYMVMLSVMSMNGGIFLVAVGGHAVGYMLFGSRIFRKSAISESDDLPPLTCC